MKRFQNNVIDQKVSAAIKDAELMLLPSSLFLQELRAKNDWKYNSGTGEKVYSHFLMDKKPLPVFAYTPFNPWTSAIGYFNGKATFINSRKLPMLDHQELVENLTHEFCHYLGFGHGNNYKTRGKCHFSVPYWASENVGRFL